VVAKRLAPESAAAARRGKKLQWRNDKWRAESRAIFAGPLRVKRGFSTASTIEAPARVFHQGPGEMPNMTGCIFAVRHLLSQYAQ